MRNTTFLTSRRRFAVAPLLAAAGACLAAAPAHAGSIHWSGDVDDVATIAISGKDARVVKATLKGVRNDHYDVRGNGLPHRPVNVTLREADGRGGVRLVQQPSPRNGFTALVRIVDKQPGQNHYDFTLTWPGEGHRPGMGMGHMGHH